MTSALEVTDTRGGEGATHPRVTLKAMEGSIAAKHVFLAADALRELGQPVHPSLSIFTICVLVFDNGFVIVGKSAPASPENFDAAKGAEFAYEDAIRQAWPLFAFSLCDHMGLSETLQAAIANERLGLPHNRADLTPESVPALGAPPVEFAMARTVVVETSQPAGVEQAWAKLRQEIAQAAPPFPPHVLGFTDYHDEATNERRLTIYA